MKITFLSAPNSLTKSYTKKGDGSILKTPYPMAYEFTSITEDCRDLKHFEQLLVAHAAKGHCLLKGEIQRPLNKESRAGSTDSTGTTDWIVLDIDGLKGGSLDDLLSAMGFTDISYVVQYSASYCVENKDLRCHVFMRLDRAISAPLLKQWLIHLNHSIPLLNDNLRLTKTNNSLSWALDISVCQNDKLIYIAPPLFKGMKDPMAKQARIEYVRKSHETLVIPQAMLVGGANAEKTNKRINELRTSAGLPARKFNFKVHGPNRILLQPDSSIITEMRSERGFVYFNLNGGDSWAYYHPEDNPEYIHNFKDEPSYLTKDLLPEYWKQITEQAVRVSADGITYLAFCDRKTGAYWRGTHDKQTDELDLYVAKNETQVRHFAKQYGVPLGDFIPEWDMEFNPHDNVRVDVENRSINTFAPTIYMQTPPKKATKCPPTIFKVMDHALGNDVDILEHFVNWLAFIVQFRDRSKTAWVLHGTQGCLAGDTMLQFKRGKRNSGRYLSVKDAYAKWTGQYKQGTGLGKSWDMTLPTYTKSVRDGMTIGYHEVFKIVESGVKQLYRVTTNTGRTIRITELHPFLRPDGTYTPLKELDLADRIIVEGSPINGLLRGGRNKQRVAVHSVPHHPYAWQHMVNGNNYKRTHRARLVVEASMNNMEYEDFLRILRTDRKAAAQMIYLREDEIVHHIDEDPTNDDISNLEIIDKTNHDAHHAKEVGMGYIATSIEHIVKIEPDAEEMTYDLVMKAPYHNYIADGFAVHNTGKGVLANKILRPLFGHHQTAMRRMEEFNEQYNSFMERCFLVFVDEVQTKALVNERGVMAKLKNFITEEHITVRQMYEAAHEVRNYTNWIFASNMPDPVAIDKEDRRFNVGKYQPQRLFLTDEELANLDKELQAFYDYLMQYPVDTVKASVPIETEDRSNMISISESSVDGVGSALLDGNFEFFLDQMPTTDRYTGNLQELNRVESYIDTLRALHKRTDDTGKCNISRDELRVLFEYCVGNIPNTPNKFTAMLRHHRIHVFKVWVGDRSVNGFKVVWGDLARFEEFGLILNPVVKMPPKAVKDKENKK